MNQYTYIKFFDSLSLDDASEFGNKATSLAHFYASLQHVCKVPFGFALTSAAYWHFIKKNNLEKYIADTIAIIDAHDDTTLHAASEFLRDACMRAVVPEDIVQELCFAYKKLSQFYGVTWCDVAVRSSATAEDLPTASFAGQQESFLNIVGEQELVVAYQATLASLFTSRAMSYRMHNGFSHELVGMAVIVQKMVRADLGCSGVMFTKDPETNFNDVIVVSSSYGLGEPIVQGAIVPDEFSIIKSKLQQGYVPIVKKKCGSKRYRMLYTDVEAQNMYTEKTRLVETSAGEQFNFSLPDARVLEIARVGLALEQDYTLMHAVPMPLDIEWAIDGLTQELFIVQVRPLTSQKESLNAVSSGELITYALVEVPEVSKIIVSGIRVGNGIVHGECFIAQSVSDAANMPFGSILVVSYTSPDWLPVMKRAKAIVTERGGRTCHAAIVARELGLSALVGAEHCMEILRSGMSVTLDCGSGFKGHVYDGFLPFVSEKQQNELIDAQSFPCALMAIIADPDKAWEVAQLPLLSGVGLVRLEFLMAHVIGIHPNALLFPDMLADEQREVLYQRIMPYACPREFFVSELARGIACIATAFGDRSVVIRTSDFKSNEYRQLFAGELFEQVEENPMLGLRGAARYLHPKFCESFSLECQALKIARDAYGAHNIDIMIPFVRSPNELAQLRVILEKEGLLGSGYRTRLLMMVEVPTNVLLLEEYARYADAFSIGSNDLTQLILGIDRDSALFGATLNETDPAVVQCISQAIAKAKLLKKPMGICGQAPADFPEFARLLINQGISSIALQSSSLSSFVKQMRSGLFCGTIEALSVHEMKYDV